MDCPICAPQQAGNTSAAGGVDVFDCPSHGKFGVIRSRRTVFDKLDPSAKLSAVETARARNMILGYPVIDAFSI